MSKTPRGFALVILVGLQLLGCDAGQKPFAQAALLESQGKLTEAAQAYDSVCSSAKESKLCPVAQRRAVQVRWNAAVSALQEGREMQTELDAIGKDSALVPLVALLNEHPEAKAARSFREGTSSSTEEEKLKKLQAISKEALSFAPKARELLKAQPDVLLQSVKDACKAGGKGSCSGAVLRVSGAFPESSQAKEAEALGKAELVRLYPVLNKLEKLLIQRLETFNLEAIQRLCMEEIDSLLECDGPHGVSEELLKNAFTKQLADLPDPELTRAFQARWELCSKGEVDPEPWPKSI